MKMSSLSSQDECYMFLWYPAPGVTRGFGVLKADRLSVLEIFKPITLPYTLAFIFGWPYITRSWFDTSLEEVTSSRDVWYASRDVVPPREA